MNEELMKKIRQAVENNDTETLENLKKTYGFSISIQRRDANEEPQPIESMLQRNNEAEIKRFEKKHNVKINRVVRDEDNNVNGFSIVKYERLNPKSMIDKKDTEYFREIPCDNDLFIIYTLASRHGLLECESDLISAFILKWINEDKVEYIPLRKGIFKRKKVMIKFKENVVIDDNMEKELYEYVKKISDDSILQDDEVFKWVEKNEFRFNDLLQNVKNDSQERLQAKGLIIINEINNNTQIVEESTNRRIIKRNSSVILPKYHEYLKQITGFKNFIKDFSTIPNKEITEVRIWANYLIVSKLLGVADYVDRQFENLIPGFKIRKKMKTRKRILVSGGMSQREIEKYLDNEVKQYFESKK